MEPQTVVPVARPSPPAPAPVALSAPPTYGLSPHPAPMGPAAPPTTCMPYAPAGYALVPVRPRTDSMAVASAICGITGVVPIICQVLGVVFGILSLLRIRRSRATDAPLGGAPWAIVGMITSGLALIGWIGLFTAMMAVSSSLGSSSDLLRSLTQHVRP